MTGKGKETALVLLTLLGILIVLNPAHSAGIQKWVDEQGKVHYGERPPASQKSKSVEQKITVVENQGQLKEIAVLYTTSRCGYCKKAKAFLSKNNIAFREVNIEKSLSAKRQFDQMGGRGVPLLVKGKSTLRGFNVRRYRRFFDL